MAMSAVWNYFNLKEEKSPTAECKICTANVSRGGSAVARFNTTNLIRHLEKHHAEQYEEFLQATAAKKSKTPRVRQQTLMESIQSREKLPPCSNKAKLITEKLVQFIVLDDQPLSVTENVGFRRLLEHLEPRYTLPSRHYITEKVIPQMYNEVCDVLSKLVENVSAISLTTDIWSSEVSPMSMLSLTAQWIDSDFSLKKAILHAREFRGSHTGDFIMAAIEEMLREWKINKNKVHVILRDNAKNMKKAMDQLGVASLGCFAHTLQLIVHEGLLSQRSVSDALANGRKIVGHFKHSPLAYARLEDIQVELNMHPKRLQQDVRTRWNSTLYMIESLIAHKRTLSAYTAEYDLPATLTANQWGLLEKASTVLAPFEEMTRAVSASSASLADVIPVVCVLKRVLSRENEDDQGIKTMKSTLLDAVNRRFNDVESEPLYSVATLLDPRYKDRYFTNADTLRLGKEALLAEVGKMEEVLKTTSETSASDSETADKTPRMEALGTSTSSLGSIFNEILEENQVLPVPKITTSAQIQVETYLSEANIPRSDDPLLYWKVNQPRLPSLAATAVKFICAPCTSVESERLFSTASNVINERRNRLTSETAEKIIFLKKNLPLMVM
ncbi:zinc finger BED domain-containing protein 4-like [Siphateles boraxobius]|uniref:zinc finger BED domain-containing protein 4-like n=1 Tax=Siphateles boraxobius TaxID=180520 RepID=UPI0040645410